MNTIERIASLSAAWAAAREVYPYFDRLSLDWDAAYREYLPQVMDAEDPAAFWLLLARFMRLLNDAHTTAVLPRALTASFGFFPFRMLQMGDRFLVTEGPDEKVLLREALAIDGIPMTEWVRRLDAYQVTVQGHAYQGRLEKWLPLLMQGTDHTLLTDGGEIPFCCVAEPPQQRKAPEPASRFPSEQLADSLWMCEGGILCARIDDMLHPDRAERFQRLLKAHSPNAVLFDIRRNMGGMTLCGAKYAQPFFEGSFSGCQKWTQKRSAVDAASSAQLLRMSPERQQTMQADGTLSREALDDARDYARRTHYERYQDSWQFPCDVHLPHCPVLLLTSRDTISAAEDFCCFFRSNHRGVLMGESTFGSTGSPLPLAFSEGGGVQIVSVGYTLLDGTPFIGRGIAPDVVCAPDVDAYRAGWDDQLDTAIQYMRENML